MIHGTGQTGEGAVSYNDYGKAPVFVSKRYVAQIAARSE